MDKGAVLDKVDFESTGTDIDKRASEGASKDETCESMGKNWLPTLNWGTMNKIVLTILDKV